MKIEADWKDILWDKISTWQSREETINNSLYDRISEHKKAEQSYKEIENYIESLLERNQLK